MDEPAEPVLDLELPAGPDTPVPVETAQPAILVLHEATSVHAVEVPVAAAELPETEPPAEPAVAKRRGWWSR